MELGDKIRQGTKWLFTGTVGMQIVQFLFGVALARILVPSDFGMLVTIQIFTGLAGYFSGAGMGQALVQVKELKTHYYNVVFTIQLFIGVIIFLIFYFVAPYFATFFENKLYSNLLRVSALSFLWRPFISIQQSKLQREMKFKEISIVRVISQIIAGAASISFALGDLRVWSLILGGMAGSLSQILLFSIFARWKPKFKFEKASAKSLGSYGFKVTANSLLNYFGQQIDNLFVSKILGASLLGLYNKGYSTSEMPKEIISNSTYTVLFRAFSKEQDDLNLTRYIYYNSIKLITVYTAPIFCGLWWISGPFINVLYGSKWEGCVPVIKILMLTGIIRCIGNISGAVIEAQNCLGKEFFIFLESLILLSAGCFFLTQKGIEFVAIVVCIQRVYVSIRIILFTCKIIGANILEILKSAFPGIFLSTIMITILYLADISILRHVKNTNETIYLLIAAALGSIVYILGFFLLPIKSVKSEVNKLKMKIGDYLGIIGIPRHF